MSQDKTPTTPTMSEREIMTDSLLGQKMMTAAYNTYAGECSSTQLRNAFLSILNDEHDIRAQIFDEMSSRGWKQPKQAEQTEILKAKQRFTSDV